MAPSIEGAGAARRAVPDFFIYELGRRRCDYLGIYIEQVFAALYFCKLFSFTISESLSQKRQAAYFQPSSFFFAKRRRFYKR